MSKHIVKSIKASACEQRTDHSEKVVNKIIEIAVVGVSAIFLVDKRDTGVIL